MRSLLPPCCSFLIMRNHLHSIYTDESLLGLGAVLMQPNHRGKLGAIVYASRSLYRAEGNYSVTLLEGLAIVWALKKF